MRKKWRASYGAHRVSRAMARAQEMAAMQKAMDQKAAALQQIAVQGPPLASPVAAVLLPGAMPVTNISLARLRSDFRETAAWQPQLRTDRNGLLETSFVLPDSLTRYRLTGVGLTRQAEIGIARTRITASMPLAVQLFLPRFAVRARPPGGRGSDPQQFRSLPDVPSGVGSQRRGSGAGGRRKTVADGIWPPQRQ